MDSPHSPRQNHLLSVLPYEEQKYLYPRLELTPVVFGQVLCECGCALSHAYFPTTSVVSLLNVMKNGSSAEIALVGNEGLVGVALFMDGDAMSNRAVAQCSGHAYRLKRELLQQEFYRSIPLQHLLLRYTQALITQMAQTAVCNRHHTVEQRLCRWLLSILDRLNSDSLKMSQEMIAHMLGVRRESITEAAGKLQSAGLIHYSRGRIKILDRARLEARTCECYRVVRKEFERLLPDSIAV